MAAENLYSLLIRVEGGDAAAAEIIKTKYALKEVETGSDHLKERFRERFQHIALKGFIADTARSIGLSRELGPLVGLLNIGINELGVAAGALGGPMSLVITGLTAVAALGFVVHEHFKKHEEDLVSLHKGYQDNAAVMDEYTEAGGRLSAALSVVAQNIKDAAAETLKKITADNAAKLAIEQNNLEMVKFDKHNAEQRSGMALTGKALEDYTKLYEKHRTAVDDLTATMEANLNGFATREEYIKSGTAALRKQADVEAHIAEDAAEDAEHERKGREEDADAYEEDGRRRQEADKRFSDDYQRDLEARIKGMERYTQALTQNQQAGVRAWNSLSQGASMAVAQTIVEAKNLEQGLKAASKMAAEQIIADLIRIQIQALATKAALAFFGGGIGATVPGVEAGSNAAAAAVSTTV